MKLKEFIKELEDIAGRVDNSKEVEVEMADCVPVVKPILKENTVFIISVGCQYYFHYLPLQKLGLPVAQ